MYEDVRYVFTDGGLVGPNPSKLGGTYAWRWLNEAEELIGECSGLLTPGQLNVQEVSNNTMELFALADALELLPSGWAGIIVSDSQMALGWAFKGWNQAKAHPASCIRIAQAVERFGDFTYVLIGGHPSKAELERGMRKDGMRVSKHNVACDKECTRLSKAYINEHPVTAPDASDIRVP